MSATIQAVRGMNDVLPGESDVWLAFEAAVEDWLAQYGYRNIRMPLVEHSQLFRRPDDMRGLHRRLNGAKDVPVWHMGAHGRRVNVGRGPDRTAQIMDKTRRNRA